MLLQGPHKQWRSSHYSSVICAQVLLDNCAAVIAHRCWWCGRCRLYDNGMRAVGIAAFGRKMVEIITESLVRDGDITWQVAWYTMGGP